LTSLNIHIVLNKRLSVGKLHDRHLVIDRSRNSIVAILKAGVISQAGSVTALPLWRRLETATFAQQRVKKKEDAYLGPCTVNVCVMQEKKRLIR
jgi:hypothetical protein